MTTPSLALAEDRWTLGLAGGVADRYTYQVSGGYPRRFEFTWLASVEAGYSLSQHLSVQGEASYLRYVRKEATGGIEEVSHPTYTLISSNPHVGTGMRLYATGPTSTRARPYLEFLPALYFSRWTEHLELSGDVTEESFTEMEPGFVAGAGFVGLNQASVRLDIGFRYYYSASIGAKELGDFSSGDFRGLRQAAVVIGVHKPL